MRPLSLGIQVGFGSFVTSTSVSGSNVDDEPFASSTNLSDAAMAKILYAGLYVPLRRSTALFDIGVRRTWHGRSVRFLTRGDIIDPARRRATGSDQLETVRHRSLPARRYRSPSSTSPVRPPSINCTVRVRRVKGAELLPRVTVPSRVAPTLVASAELATA